MPIFIKKSPGDPSWWMFQTSIIYGIYFSEDILKSLEIERWNVLLLENGFFFWDVGLFSPGPSGLILFSKIGKTRQFLEAT